MSLDIDYANMDFIPDGGSYLERWEAEGRAFRTAHAAIGRARLNVAYGPGERQRFDLFHPAGQAEGLVVFVHGGYWLRFDRSLWSQFSAGLTARGWAVAMPSYTLAPEARIGAITREIARAVEAAAGLVAGPVRITGHSAGGHLSARIGCRDVALDAEVRSRLARIVPISPVGDLRPLLGTSMNATLRLDEAEAAAESPVLHPAPDIPVTVWVGAEERPVFLDQARWLADAWGASHRIDPGRHHFDVLDGLVDAESPLTTVILA
jgi:acetyl esterase/lipase